MKISNIKKVGLFNPTIIVCKYNNDFPIILTIKENKLVLKGYFEKYIRVNEKEKRLSTFKDADEKGTLLYKEETDEQLVLELDNISLMIWFENIITLFELKEQIRKLQNKNYQILNNKILGFPE